MFPTHRPRRLRRTEALRRLVAEAAIRPSQLVLPMFVKEGATEPIPISSMPVALQVITYIVPARYFLVALRGVLLKGVGIGAIAPQLGALTIFAVLVMLLAARRLRQEWA